MVKENFLYKVKDLPLADRPREKFYSYGATNLTDAELLAIILRTGTKGKSVIHIAQTILAKYSLTELAGKSVDFFTQFSGIGKDKAISLAAVFEVGRRAASQKSKIFDKQITSPDIIANFFIPLLKDEKKENFIIVLLNSANKINKYEVLSIGTLNSSVVHPREVFRIAVENNAASIILIHNHPSGNISPSKADIKITKKLIEAGSIFDIPILDHLIIAGDEYLSFSEAKII